LWCEFRPTPCGRARSRLRCDFGLKHLGK
jgi:hypothetical protein